MGQVYAVTSSGERAAFWRRTFDTDRLPVVSPRPERATVGGNRAKLEMVLMVDVEQFTPEQLAHAAAVMAPAYGMTPEEARYRLITEGVPLVVEGLTLERDFISPWRWEVDEARYPLAGVKG